MMIRKSLGLLLLFALAMPSQSTMAQQDPVPNQELFANIKLNKEDISTNMWCLLYFPPKSLAPSVLNESRLKDYLKILGVELGPKQLEDVLQWTLKKSVDQQTYTTVKFCQDHADELNKHLENLAHLMFSKEKGQQATEQNAISSQHLRNYVEWRVRIAYDEIITLVSRLRDLGHLAKDSDIAELVAKVFAEANVQTTITAMILADVKTSKKANLLMWPVTIFDSANIIKARTNFTKEVPSALYRILNESKLYGNLPEESNIIMKNWPSQEEEMQDELARSPEGSFIIDASAIFMQPAEFQLLRLKVADLVHDKLYLVSKKIRTHDPKALASALEKSFVAAIAVQDYRASHSLEESTLQYAENWIALAHKNDPLFKVAMRVSKQVFLQSGFPGLQRLVEFLQDGRIDEKLVAEGADAVLKLFE